MQGYLLNRILFLLGRVILYFGKELLQCHVVTFVSEILCSIILCVHKVLHFCPRDYVPSVDIVGSDSLKHPEIETCCL